MGAFRDLFSLVYHWWSSPATRTPTRRFTVNFIYTRGFTVNFPADRNFTVNFIQDREFTVDFT